MFNTEYKRPWISEGTRDFLRFASVIVTVMTAFAFLAYGVSILDAKAATNAMREAGYESKRVGVYCFAKYNGRWLSCKAVYENQVEVVGEVKK